MRAAGTQPAVSAVGLDRARHDRELVGEHGVHGYGGPAGAAADHDPGRGEAVWVSGGTLLEREVC